ncbi:hypothetical protein VA7868_02351 [Vibrio aerogenes CECT 7868]|uniref:Uncharacterized protein n=1 Tax=Vibrio aerogenes CECT 7868 TaxID=1216006 RepID=A0A1M5Z6M6_9VIBR|nr:hypothetical protein [Vibrio aerogenes]SHI19814.1 hypothetical protein VA7868_02351 [Vibrio aerogenes CECT 7868]
MTHKKPTDQAHQQSSGLDIHKRSMDAVPRWALAICAVLLVLSFAIRQIGLDITTPLNKIMAAYAARIENRSLAEHKKLSRETHHLEDKINRLEIRVTRLEHQHPVMVK